MRSRQYRYNSYYRPGSQDGFTPAYRGRRIYAAVDDTLYFKPRRLSAYTILTIHFR